MTPKEKAEQLIEKFAPTMPNEDWKEKAKRCALIAVDEIIIQGGTNTHGITFWQIVKNTLNNLYQ